MSACKASAMSQVGCRLMVASMAKIRRPPLLPVPGDCLRRARKAPTSASEDRAASSPAAPRGARGSASASLEGVALGTELALSLPLIAMDQASERPFASLALKDGVADPGRQWLGCPCRSWFIPRWRGAGLRLAVLAADQADIAAGGGKVGADHPFGGKAGQVMGTAGLGPGARQPLAAERLGADHGADLVAIDVDIAHPGPLGDVARHRGNAAVHAEGEAIAGGIDGLDHLVEASTGK